jgi:4-hydroxymandelate oxidase
MSTKKLSDRRAFLNFLGASPILATGFTSRALQSLASQESFPASHEPSHITSQNDVIIKSVKEALNINDFDAAARSKLSAAHYGVVTDGAFNNETLRANREAFAKYQIRLRRLTGIRKVDQSVSIFGLKWDSPIFLSPVGRMNAFYPDGAVVVARAAKSTCTLQILSGSPTMLSVTHGIDDVNRARSEPVWVAVNSTTVNQSTIKRIEATGCPTLVWTVDDTAAGNTVGAKSLRNVGVADLNRQADSRCSGCHNSLPPAPRIEAKTPMDLIGAVGGYTDASSQAPNWDDVKRVKDMTSMKLVLKGIVTREDAELAVEHGVDGIIVSNHGGHDDASGRGSIECLPEVIAGVAKKIPVLIDSGFRWGADVFKALALGAVGVGIGRPHIWGLASFGQEGVETVIELLRRELQVVMAQTNSASIGEIRSESLMLQTGLH